MSKRNYNSQAFIPEEVEQGLHWDLIKYLLDYNSKSNDYYNDIHITTDSYCTIVEWTLIPYDHSYGGKFEFIDEDYGQVVMLEKIFPDNHYEYFTCEEEYEEALEKWLEENPEYKEKGTQNV